MNTATNTFKSADLNTDFEVRTENSECVNYSALDKPLWSNLKFTVAGILFGIILVKSEVISWFRLQSFYMYGVIGSAIVVGIISIFIIKKFKIRSIDGEEIRLDPKKFNKGQVYGGLLFGFGWALTGACPGPLFALIGSSSRVIIVTLVSAIADTWVYGYLRDKLPH